MSWHFPDGSLCTETTLATVTPEIAGWTYSGIQIFNFAKRLTVELTMTGVEGVLLPLSAQNLQVTLNDAPFTLKGRSGVFAAVSDWLYLPVNSKVSITGTTGEFALCTARTTQEFPAYYTAAQDVSVEVRGSGQATRQVTNIATSSSFAGAHKINVCEVLTPGANWSSWPPNRHDGIGDCPYNNEEIYYFRIGTTIGDHGDPDGQGLFHVYTVDGEVDETTTLHDGDIYIVPKGFHGPSVAAPEYPLYFLNVLAGPAQDRTMAFCDDPAHHWIRDSWTTQVQDPRCPMTNAEGKVTR